MSEKKKDKKQAFLKELEEAVMSKDTVIWRQSWSTVRGLPKNAKTGSYYGGTNATRLINGGFDFPEFIGFKQLRQLKKKFKSANNPDNPAQTVAKGEGISIVIPKMVIKRELGTWEPILDEDGNPQKYMKFGFSKVFNMCLVEGFEIPQLKPNAEYKADIEQVLAAWTGKPPVTHEEGKGCFYRRAHHEVIMPAIEFFSDEVEYYATLFHELIHSTSKFIERECHEKYHKSKKFRAQEELVAEIGGMLLCAHFKIENKARFDMTANYVKSWQDVLTEDVGMSIQRASTMAQAAVDLILNKEKK